VLSGWLTDRVDPRVLLLAYYGLRGLSLFLLPTLFGPDLHVSMVAFIVFYGLDWVATVPPTLALCREFFGPRAPVVFGWVFASHQVGSAFAAFGGGVIRDVLGGESPVVLSREVYVTAALLGAAVFVALAVAGLSREIAGATGFVAALALRGAALHWGWSLPRYRPRPGRHPDEIPRREKRP